jgi:hypothetical protein
MISIDKETCAVELQASHTHTLSSLASKQFLRRAGRTAEPVLVGLEPPRHLSRPRWSVVFAQRAKLSVPEDTVARHCHT